MVKVGCGSGLGCWKSIWAGRLCCWVGFGCGGGRVVVDWEEEGLGCWLLYGGVRWF